MDLKFLIAIFPVVFMFHDFEEIVFFKFWLTKNKEALRDRFPRIAEYALPHLEKLSTAALSLAVAEDFILLSIVTYASIWWDHYLVWFAIFMAFSIHLILHCIQWIIFRRYIPGIVTSLLSLPYCVYTFFCFSLADIMNAAQMVLWTIVGLVMMILNLFLAHKLAIRFARWSAISTPTL